MDSKAPKKTAWITGAAGLIGRCLGAAPSPFQIIPLIRQTVELTDFKAVEKKFREDQPDLIIHCAAMSKSPDCQAHPDRARLVNIEVTRHLAQLAQDRAFIFFSSDLVFDGRRSHYTELDPVSPLSIYGETKAEAERVVLQNPRHGIVRTSLNSGRTPHGSAYNEQLVAAWQRGLTLNLFVDEFRCPIPATVTARAVWELAAQPHGGIFHVAGRERLSRVEIGHLAAARHPEVKARINPESLQSYTGAPRPADPFLDCSKIQKLLSFPLPGLSEYLLAHPEEPF